MYLPTDFIIQTCCIKDCGISWAITRSFVNFRKNDHQDFYCPNGHSQHYPGQSELVKAKKEIRQLRNNLDEMTDCSEHQKRTIVSLKGVITKMRKKEE